jgi:hypothetical protein
MGKFARECGWGLGGMPVTVLHSALWWSDNMLYLLLYHVSYGNFKEYSRR